MRIINVVFAVIVCTFSGGAIASGLDISPAYGILGMNGIGVAMSFVKVYGLRATVYTEIWTGELVKQFSHADTATFLDGIPDYSRYVENDVIHLVDVGIDPDVLINNNTYPIPIQELPDGDIAISLDKFTTKTTTIKDDDLYALGYDRIGSVKERHGNSLTESKHDKSIHAFAPATHSAATPVIPTTGDDDGNGRKRLKRDDIIALKAAFDKAKVPKKGRRLVLCDDHINDMLLFDQKFKDQYYDYESGKIAKIASFEIYEYGVMPDYDAAGVKKAFGSIPNATDYNASVAFLLKRMFKANGSTKMYWSAAENDPDTHQNKVNFETRAIYLPQKLEAIGAIRSVVAA